MTELTQPGHLYRHILPVTFQCLEDSIFLQFCQNQHKKVHNFFLLNGQFRFLPVADFLVVLKY